ncbi:LysR substrate-binding domain-containing protein [Oceanisphaera pacifica]|uniref:LysR family transcriptional regulator n=1 Tax=Oceanisphaera pacifica TaxID=2818389 RepID=A0ABS3NKC8_9GAMM|nr:LysR family transcriptional regulator [Oceanisphaera pacifica]
MELRHLRYFIVAAEELNLTRAAEKLFIAQPPLTRQIKQLEDELEVQLFIRKARGLELTESGRFFLKKAHAILSQLNATIKATREVEQNSKTVFSIGFVPSVFYAELPLIVRRLRRNKRLEIVLHDLKAQEQNEALKSGKIDIGFGRIEIEDPDIEQEILFNEPLVAVLPEEHTLVNQQPTIQQLADFPLITFPSGSRPNFSDIILALFHRQGLKVQVTQQVDDLQTALSLVASDMGFSLVPEQVRTLRRGGVEFVKIADESITIPLIASRRRGENPNAVMRLMNTILAEIIHSRSRESSL